MADTLPTGAKQIKTVRMTKEAYALLPDPSAYTSVLIVVANRRDVVTQTSGS